MCMDIIFNVVDSNKSRTVYNKLAKFASLSFRFPKAACLKIQNWKMCGFILGKCKMQTTLSDFFATCTRRSLTKWARSLVVSDLRSETQGSRFESSC